MRPLAIAAALALSGCGGGLLAPAGPAPKIYTLSAPAVVETNAPRANWQLVVDMPDAILDLNSSRIALRPEPTRIDYYANVQWGDRPPAMLQELLLRAFERSGLINAAQRQGGDVKADFELAIDLHDFEVDTGAAGADVDIAMTARLIRGRDREIVASRAFETRAPVNGDLDGAVRAFDAALHELLPRIVDWTLSEGNRNP